MKLRTWLQRLVPRRASVKRRAFPRIPVTGRALAVLTFLSILGPGLVSAIAGDDAGGIGTYSVVGAKYGYTLLWALVIVIIGLAVVQEMAARLAVVTGKGLADLIREQFGVRTTNS